MILEAINITSNY